MGLRPCTARRRHCTRLRSRTLITHGACSNPVGETMDQKTRDLRQSLIFQPSLLSFESQREYRQLADAIRDHISPRDIWEEMWTSEIVEAEWEIARLRRYKAQIVNLEKLVSLRN